MDSTKPEIVLDYSPSLRVYKDGTVERLSGTDVVSPSLDDPETNVQSKDVVYSQELNLSSRLFLLKHIYPNQKVPLLVYYHGGGFCTETPFSSRYHNFCTRLVAESNIIVVSVDYRRVPEHHLPAAYDDSWTAFKWVASHVNKDGPDEWLNCHADFSMVFLAGDSAGGNIAHNMAMKYGQEKLSGLNVVGMLLIHPYFWGKEPIGIEMKEYSNVRGKIDSFWYFACPTTSGLDDPLVNPAADPKFGTLGCSRVLIFVAQKDFLRDRGWFYRENLIRSGWTGEVEVFEAKDEIHVYHLVNPESENAKILLNKIVSFIHPLEVKA